MIVLAVLVRLVHIAFAVIVAGGAVYQWLVVQPLLQSLDVEQRKSLRDELAARWRPLVMMSVGMLLLTGFLNFLIFKVPQYRGYPSAGIYHAVIGLKILLAMGVLHTMTMLVMPGEKFDKKYRQRAGFWLGLSVALLTAIIILGSVANNFKALFPDAAA